MLNYLLRIIKNTRPGCYEIPSKALVEAWWEMYWRGKKGV